MMKNEERIQTTRTKELAKKCTEDFRTLVDEMDPQYKIDGCDYESVDAYLYEELEMFKKTLKSECFSDELKRSQLNNK
ncbi:hypothetical protein F8M41_009058 [Gigaspora margarita]|uniref:Uncharacterized protein n=1 Tax=Gigaspora margarita TaxID=4874 RepID=A0A8H4AV76_GIGMA|nr:hypothetical protein F8M41_009058 [Gigaspora margarita]